MWVGTSQVQNPDGLNICLCTQELKREVETHNNAQHAIVEEKTAVLCFRWVGMKNKQNSSILLDLQESQSFVSQLDCITVAKVPEEIWNFCKCFIRSLYRSGKS